MKKIRADMFADAHKKNEQAKKFFDTIKKEEESKKLSKEWMIELEDKCLQTKAYYCGDVRIIGGNKKEFVFEEKTKDFSNEFDAPYKAKKIRKWAIVGGEYVVSEYDTFLSELYNAINSDFHYNYGTPTE